MARVCASSSSADYENVLSIAIITILWAALEVSVPGKKCLDESQLG